MERTILHQLRQWKASPYRKPLILLGARQVGKTYILRQFGELEYDQVAYVNCDNNAQAAQLFASDYDMRRVLLAIGAITGVKVEPGKTLIILDEVQELPRGLSSLKYFCEEAPQYHVAVAGSLLGIAMHQGESSPAGKADILHMYPMTYAEFLLASGKAQMLDLLRKKDWPTIRLLRGEYIKLLRQYYFVGGMPEAVSTYVQTGDAVRIRQVQKAILTTYKSDMSKHAPAAEVARIGQVWRSIPSQLAKENRKFIYGVVKKGGRAKEFELALQWLADAGLIHRVYKASEARMPLAFYEDTSAFKVYMLDVGLLGAMSNTPPQDMLMPSEKVVEAKGAWTENYVITQLVTLDDTTLCYYSADDSRMGIDALAQVGGDIYPIEVKAEENLRSKSLRTFTEKNPKLRGLRFSMSDYRRQDWMDNVPLYACKEYLERRPDTEAGAR